MADNISEELPQNLPKSNDEKSTLPESNDATKNIKLPVRRMSPSSSKSSSSKQAGANGDPNTTPRKSSRLSLKPLPSYSLQPSPLIHQNEVESPKVENSVSGVIKRGDDLVFVEPTLPEPKQIYTGFPLEAPPSDKIKKESLWPTKKKKLKKNRDDIPLDDLEISEKDIRALLKAQAKYKDQLESKHTEEVTSLSNSRTPLKIKLRQNIKKVGEETPKQSKRNGKEHLRTPMKSNKRIKVISPKKVHSTNLAPIPVSESDNKEKEETDTIDNDDYCSACGGSGIFICCETCPKSFHFDCCSPPLEEVPEDDWYCRECIAQKFPETLTNWNHIGIFKSLLFQQEARNPFEFQLPRSIRENTFMGVTTGENGEYSDDSMLPELPSSKAHGPSQIKGCNKDIDLEVDSLFDKKGNAYLCFKCKESGMNRRVLAHCHYCPLVWHLDCLDYPMCTLKTIGSKWRCPNHIDNLFPQSFLNFRMMKETQVEDTSLMNHFLTIANQSNFIIHHEDQPFLKQKAKPQLTEYLQYESEDFGNTKGLEEEKIEVPSYFENVSVKEGIKAKYRFIQGKDIIHRVPEKLIVVDFISKVEKDIKRTVLSDLDKYEYLARVETNTEDEEVYTGLDEIKNQPREESRIKIKDEGENTKDEINLEELVKVALEYSKEEYSAKVALEVSKENYSSQFEEEDLKHIKKLIELKGRDALLEFLKS